MEKQVRLLLSLASHSRGNVPLMYLDALCLEPIDRRCCILDITIRWDAHVTSFEETDNQVHVHFADEEKYPTETVDILIGADGIHSPIRKQLTEDEIRPAGYNSIVGLIKKESDGSNDDLFKHELINNTGALVSCW